MRRLIGFKLNALVNTSVLQHYKIKIDEQCDMSNLSETDACVVRQALTDAIMLRYKKASAGEIESFVNIVMKFVMRLPATAANSLIIESGDLNKWRDIAESQRRSLVKFHESYGLPLVPLQVVVTEQLLERIEELYFG